MNFMSISRETLITGGAALILVILVGAAFMFRGSGLLGSNSSGSAPKASSLDLPTANLAKLYSDITATCSAGDENCYNDGLKTITAEFGPVPALDVLLQLEGSHLIQASTDDHQLAHAIGRKTAESFGVHGDGFLLCPTAFNYGCQHGYFEYALGRANSTKDVINQICGAFETDPAFSSKFKFYCYHGVGHGVMMAEAYDLTASIGVCDSLDSMTAIDGCWQGVFMENVNAGMRGEARDGIFSTTDPLAPCAGLREKYRHECFINHSGWLMRVFNNSVAEGTKSCLKAPLGSINSCMQSIGLMVTNPVWQTALAKSSVEDPPAGGSESIAWKLCREFPSGYVEQCMLGAVDNILNFDELVVVRASSFCGLVDGRFQNSCYERIGLDLRAQATDDATVRNQCANVPGEWRSACLKGGNL